MAFLLPISTMLGGVLLGYGISNYVSHSPNENRDADGDYVEIMNINITSPKSKTPESQSKSHLNSDSNANSDSKLQSEIARDLDSIAHSKSHINITNQHDKVIQEMLDKKYIESFNSPVELESKIENTNVAIYPIESSIVKELKPHIKKKIINNLTKEILSFNRNKLRIPAKKDKSLSDDLRAKLKKIRKVIKN